MGKKISQSEFIEKAKAVHGDKYDYSKVEYINKNTKVCIICPEHGEFWQEPRNHLNGQICHRCSQTIKAKKVPKSSKKEFIEKAKKVHGNKYDYSKVEYKNNKTKVCIICPIHGEFWQTPNCHLNGQGCKKCGIIKNGLNKKLSVQEFIEKAKKVHGDKYDYSKVEYINNRSKICIICPKHGEFWQTPNNHLRGNKCPKCCVSSMEEEIIKILNEKNIKFEFNIFPKFLNGLQLDFYLPDYNVAIECQGIQHFKDNHFFEGLNVILERDKRKKELCDKNNIKLFYYSNLGITYPYKVYENKEILLKKIIYEQ